MALCDCGQSRFQLNNWPLDIHCRSILYEAANQSLPSNRSVYGEISSAQLRAQLAQRPSSTHSTLALPAILFRFLSGCSHSVMASPFHAILQDTAENVPSDTLKDSTMEPPRSHRWEQSSCTPIWTTFPAHAPSVQDRNAW